MKRHGWFFILAALLSWIPSSIANTDLGTVCLENSKRIIGGLMGPALKAKYDEYLTWDNATAIAKEPELSDFMNRTITGGDRTYTIFMYLNEPTRIFNQALMEVGFWDLNGFAGDTPTRPAFISNVIHRLETYRQAGQPALPSKPDPFNHFKEVQNLQSFLATLGSLTICSGSNQSGCPGGFRKLMNRANLRGLDSTGYLMLYTDVLRSLLIDKKYFDGTMRAVTLVLNRVTEAIANNRGVSGKLHTDILQGYLDSGMSPSEAETASYLLLGLYGIRGATYNYALEDNLFDPPFKPMIFAVSALSFAISYLDKASFDGGTYYSLPAGIRAPCVFGKAYRFWLAAFQSHLLKTEFHQGKDAISSSVATAMVYSAFADYNSRAKFSADYTQLQSPANDGHRMDLLFATLGSAVPFIAPGETIDASTRYQGMLQAARPFQTTPRKPSLGDWKKVIAPFGAL